MAIKRPTRRVKLKEEGLIQKTTNIPPTEYFKIYFDNCFCSSISRVDQGCCMTFQLAGKSNDHLKKLKANVTLKKGCPNHSATQEFKRKFNQMQESTRFSDIYIFLLLLIVLEKEDTRNTKDRILILLQSLCFLPQGLSPIILVGEDV